MSESIDLSSNHIERVSNWPHHGYVNVRNVENNTVKLGQSFKSCNDLPTLMTYKDYSIVVGIQVTNLTKNTLEDPRAVHFAGYISTAAFSVLPKRKEALIGHKHGYTMSGSKGMITWRVGNGDRRVLVVWSSPYFGSNVLAVGFSKKGVREHEDTWYRSIMKNENNPDLKYERRVNKTDSREISMVDEEGIFEIKGSMGTSSKPEIYIEFNQLK